MLADIHRIIGVAVVHHSLGDGGGGMLFVREHTNLRGTLDEGAVEF